MDETMAIRNSQRSLIGTDATEILSASPWLEPSSSWVSHPQKVRRARPNKLPELCPERPHDARAKTRWLTVLLRLIVVIALLGATVAALSLLVRSEWFLRKRIDPKLESMGDKLHGTFHYDAIRPAGLTGIILEGVAFTPAFEDPEQMPGPIRIQKLVIYPDIAAMLTGDLQAKLLEVYGIHAELWLDGGPDNRGHWPWLESIAEAWNSSTGTSSGGGTSSAPSRFPDIHIMGGRLDLRAPNGTMPHLGLRVDDLWVRRQQQQLEVDGAIHVDGLGYALLSGDASNRVRRAGVVVKLVDAPDLLGMAPQQKRIRELVGENSRLELGGVAFRWPPALVLHDLKLTDTHIGVPGQDAAYIESLQASQIVVTIIDKQADVSIEDLEVAVRVGWMERLAASIPIRLPQLAIGLDYGKKRIGAAFTVGNAERGSLTLNAALDLIAFDLAVKIDADHFDAGPMLSFIPYTGPVDFHAGIIDGSAMLRFPLSEGLLYFDGFLNFSRVDTTIPWVSSLPLENLDLTLDIKSLVDLHERRLNIEDATLAIGELMFVLSGTVEQTGEGRHVLIKTTLSGENLRAERALDSLPTGFAPALEGYVLEGEFGLAFDLDLDTRAPESMRLRHHFDMSKLTVVHHGPKADIPLLKTNAFAVRVNAASSATLIGPQEAGWTPYFRVPKFLPAALIAAEDGAFYHHDGFDQRAIQSSLISNLQAGRIVRGGSTISQQVAKNLFLNQDKTLSRKFQEAFLTWQLEEHIDKQRIIELYINLAHWGPNVYGIKSAAEYFFRKRASRLSLRECLFLASILPNPVRFGRHYAEGYIQSDRLNKMRSVLFVLHSRGHVDRQTYEQELHAINRANISSSPRPKVLAAAPSGAEDPSND